MEKIKLAIITHFSSGEIRKKLDLHPTTKRHYRYKDFALWNVNIINGLKGRKDIDVHVISYHHGMKKRTQEFELDGIKYYIYNPDLQYPWAYFEHFILPQGKRGYPRNRKYVKEFLAKIKPDLVNLIGAENPPYSITALDVKDTPIILHCETVYANPDRIKNEGTINKERWDLEVELFHKIRYMACNGGKYYNLIKGYEPNAIIFPRRWPAAAFPKIMEVEKKYDFVFYAHYLTKKKGFNNAIEAMAMFLMEHPDAKFLAVGAPNLGWDQFENRIKELNLYNNLEIHPPFKEYVDMLQYVKQARFALLPITMDVVSGTILEAMRMGLPVVTCRTSGTPSLNEKRETVLISEIGDSEGLCQNMLRLYESPELQNELRGNGYLYIKEMDFANSHNTEEMVAQYKAVINHYRHNIPIPKDMLFDKNILFM